jgi:hypothetical protein
MASNESLAVRRAAAEARIKKISGQMGVQQQPVPGKDPDLAHVIQLENAAAAMEHQAAGAGMQFAPETQGPVPENHRRVAGATYALHEYVTPPEERDFEAGVRSGKKPSLQQQRAAAHDPSMDQMQIPDSDEQKAALEAQRQSLADAEQSGADADTAADDETDQSDEAKARRASAHHRAVEHRTTKK